MNHAKAYAVTLILFLAIDALWLGVVARDFYASQIGDRLREQPDLFVAALFYLGYAGSIVFFAVVPALNAGSWKVAARNGGLLGLTAYGAYELTNFATLPDWPAVMTLVDMIWGALLTGVVAAGGYLGARTRKRKG